MARERREGTARDIGERKGENCNIVMIFCEIWGETKGVARITLQTLWGYHASTETHHPNT